MSRKDDNFWVLIDQLDRPKRTADQVAADIAAALKAGPSPHLCKALAEMIDPKGRPTVRWRLKLQRAKQGRPEADLRIGMEMATLVDDEGVPPRWRRCFEFKTSMEPRETADLRFWMH